MALTENGLSIADAMALAGNNNSEGGMFGGGAGGTWIWVFFLFFLLAWGGGGMFGGNNAGTAMESALTRAELYNGLGQQDVFRNQSELKQELSAFERDAANRWGDIKYDNLAGVNSLQRDLCQGFNGVNTSIAATNSNLAAQLSENRFAQQQCCCETNRNIDAVRYENAKNTCDIIAANTANTQRVVDMMMQNQIETLRDELATTRSALSNTTQTQSILGALQPVPRPAYVTASPYTSVNYCGCGV